MIPFAGGGLGKMTDLFIKKSKGRSLKMASPLVSSNPYPAARAILLFP
jgi:hypothetical protein